MVLFFLSLFFSSLVLGGMQFMGINLSTYPLVEIEYSSDEGPAVAITENGEQLPFTHSQLPTGQKAPVDLLFLLDTSPGIEGSIVDLLNQIQLFSRQLAFGGVNLRLGLVTFGAEVENVYSFGENVEAFESWLRATPVRTSVSGSPSAALDALVRGVSLGFRPGAKKVFVLVSNSPFRQALGQAYSDTLSVAQVSLTLIDLGVQLFCVGGSQANELANKAGGMYFDSQRLPFSSILSTLSGFFTSSYTAQFRVPNPGPSKMHQVTLFGQRECTFEFQSPERVQVTARSIQATGMGVVPDPFRGSTQGWVLAREAAILDAQRLLLECSLGVKILANKTMEDSIFTDRRAQSALNGWISGAYVDSESYDPAQGVYRVLLHVDFLGEAGLIQLLKNTEQYQESMDFSMVNNFALSALSKGWVRAEGYGAMPVVDSPGKALVKARNAAILSAQVRLLEILQGGMISSSVEDLSLAPGASSLIYSKIEGLLKNATILEEGLLAQPVGMLDGLYRVQMAVPLDPRFGVQGILLNEVGDLPEFQLAPEYVVGGNPGTSEYDGLVLNAMDMGFSQELLPRILDEEGKVMYSIKAIGPRAESVMVFSPTFFGACQLIGAINPLEVKVLRAEGRDLYVSMEDAAKILEALKQYNFFQDGKVAVALGG